MATLRWQVPSTVGLSFSAILESDTPLTGVAVSDFRYTIEGFGNLFSLPSGTTLTPVPNTNNWQLDMMFANTSAFTIMLRLLANSVQESGSSVPAADFISSAIRVDPSFVPPPPLSIEAIDEQSIPVLTKDYVLEIDIGGEPDRAYVDGDMEGFYHDWDPDAPHGSGTGTGVLRIKSVEVTRLLRDAIWNVHLVRGTNTLDGRITYSVVPRAPVIVDPGAKTLYKGALFSEDIEIANKPSVSRGSGLLSGLKYTARADSVDGLNIAGMLPADANLTESAFNAAMYAENDGGVDNLAVPVTIEKDAGVYAYDSNEDDLIKVGPDAATLRWRYEAPFIPLRNTYEQIVASPDGVYMFSDNTDDLIKVSPDGDQLWLFSDARSGHYAEMIVTLSGTYLYQTGGIGNIYKVHPLTGESIWSLINFRFNDFLVFEGDVYVFRDFTRGLTRLDGDTGATLWTYVGPSGQYSYPPAIAGDDVYLLKSGNRIEIYKVNIADGTQAWSYRFLGRSQRQPVADSTGVYVFEGTTNRLYKINAADGSLAWTFNSPFSGSPILDSNDLYLDSAVDGRFARINPSTGAQEWLYTAPSASRSPVFLPSGIYFFNFNNDTFIKLNKSTGTVDWNVTRTNFRNGGAGTLFEDGSDLYVNAGLSALVKLRVSDGSEIWRYPSGADRLRWTAIPNFQLPA